MPASKQFRWLDIERILSVVSRDTPDDEQEYLAWLRAFHIFAISFRYVHDTAARSFNISGLSKLGGITYRTIDDVVNMLDTVRQRYPQEMAKFVREIVEDPLGIGAGAQIEEGTDGEN